MFKLTSALEPGWVMPEAQSASEDAAGGFSWLLRWLEALPTDEETRRDERELGEGRLVPRLGTSREEKDTITVTATKTAERKLYN